MKYFEANQHDHFEDFPGSEMQEFSEPVGESKVAPYEKPVEQHVVRPNWGKKLEFILACVGYAVGLGNVWRFPYLCYISGGGAFLIPYFIMLFLCGIPLLYMEMAVGQYTRLGPIGALEKLCPLFKGAGLATVVISYLLCTYYNVIIAWAGYYFVQCFQTELPWATCNHTWNSDKCWDDYSPNATLLRPNDSVSPSEEFYNNNVLEQTSGIDVVGSIRWQLLIPLFISWVAVYFCIWKGVKSTGKVVYFTATFPYVVLIVLFGRGITLPGSYKGISFFIYPKWELLLDPAVWVNAAAQNFNSIGIAFGSLIAFSSYNKFNNRIFPDVMSVSLLNAATSIFAGFVIFSILGHIAYTQGKEVEDVVTQGPGLVFVTYPAALVNMPISQLWAALFFFMLMCLGIDSQFAMVEVIITSLEDHFGRFIYRFLRRKELLVLVVCVISFLIGLIYITQGGIYFFRLVDAYAAGISLMYLAFFEVVAIVWIYGANRLARNVKEMTGNYPYMYFRVCWWSFAPLLILAIWIFGWVKYKPITYGNYIYPDWAIGLGWGVALLSILCIPGGMIHALYQAEGQTLWQRFRNSLRSKLEDSVPKPFNGVVMVSMNEKEQL
ncbi:sodium- and chloride-dependent GABA transporter ine [Lingula anatina]|uniref:Transporter n=1 Tax=Lingula anatina TaxID=7574 RepID=A0A1S3JUI9_LINAN|nr:sodium- and chloride-dependent GABA transporter ine [Lingula anatina]|eukprot:XP_013413993.1 sodium- and chloride-dependent GABA transporter ine [Lingula anatina]